MSGYETECQSSSGSGHLKSIQTSVNID